MSQNALLLIVSAMTLWSSTALGVDVQFRLTIPASLAPPATTSTTPAPARAVVYLIRENADVGRADPADAPFFEDPQPMFGVDVAAPSASTPIVIASAQEGVTCFPVALAELPAGRYRVQGVLDLHRQNSSWRREPGNLYSGPQTVILADGVTIDVPLDRRVEAQAPPAARDVEYVEIPSPLLTAFRGQPTTLRAGVLKPEGYLPSSRYPAIFEVPGFGGDHTSIVHRAQARMARPRDPLERMLSSRAFWIVLDPEGPNGHHLFADSPSNGPVARALVEELIPELTRRYNLIDAPDARLLRGHSSGGWSVLWLATRYPDVFGAAWSSSPDPVDFRRFQLVDVYAAHSMYTRPTSTGEPEDTPSYTDEHATPRMTIRQENAMEEVLGPANTSAQQWDSWMAVFAPRSTEEPTGVAAGANLYDPATGTIDAGVAAAMRPYDIADTLRKDPSRFGPVFRDHVRLIVGDMDNYALNEGVKLLEDDLQRLGFLGSGRPPAPGPDGDHNSGYIKIVPGLDHSSVFGSAEMRDIPRQMLEYLDRHHPVGR